MGHPKATDGLAFAWSRVLTIAIVAFALCAIVVVGGWRGGQTAVRYVRDLRREWVAKAALESKVQQAQRDLAALARDAEAAKVQIEGERRKRLAAEREAQEARAARANEQQNPVDTNEGATTALEDLQKQAFPDLQAQHTAIIGGGKATPDQPRGPSTNDAPTIPPGHREVLPAPPERIQPAPMKRVTAFQSLFADAKHRWVNAETVIVSGEETGYLQAADELHEIIADIAAFERENGSLSESDELRNVTLQKLDQLATACSAENDGNRKRRAKEVPCPRNR